MRGTESPFGGVSFEVSRTLIVGSLLPLGSFICQAHLCADIWLHVSASSSQKVAPNQSSKEGRI